MSFSIPKGILKAFAMVLIIFFLLGFAYPTVSAAISEHVLPNQSYGSRVEINGKVYGSYLLAEAFNSSIFFQPRPSAVGYNLSQSGSYSYTPSNPEMVNLTEGYIHQFLKENPGVNVSQIPYSIVAPSGSGLDPNVPLAGAKDQVQRIAISIHNLSAQVYDANGTGQILGVNSTAAFLNAVIKEDEKQNFPVFGSIYVNTVALNFAIIKLLMDKGVISQSFLD